MRAEYGNRGRVIVWRHRSVFSGRAVWRASSHLSTRATRQVAGPTRCAGRRRRGQTVKVAQHVMHAKHGAAAHVCTPLSAAHVSRKARRPYVADRQQLVHLHQAGSCCQLIHARRERARSQLHARFTTITQAHLHNLLIASLHTSSVTLLTLMVVEKSIMTRSPACCAAQKWPPCCQKASKSLKWPAI